MHLTSFTDYALRSLMYLANKPNKICNVSEIAIYFGISQNHLVKIIHRLVQFGYIHSTKGKGGGLRLACDPLTLKLGDLVKKLEPNMYLVECFNSTKNTCNITNFCKLKHVLHQANECFVAKLNQSSLADILLEI